MIPRYARYTQGMLALLPVAYGSVCLCVIDRFGQGIESFSIGGGGGGNMQALFM